MTVTPQETERKKWREEETELHTSICPLEQPIAINPLRESNDQMGGRRRGSGWLPSS
jgi:hypothetical protein